MSDSINHPFHCILTDGLLNNEFPDADPFPTLPNARCAGVYPECPAKLCLLCLDCDLLHLYGDRSHFSHVSFRLSQYIYETEIIETRIRANCKSIRDMLELLSIGDPDARISMPLDFEVFRELEPLLNRMADFMKYQIEETHETAIGLCEHYETLLEITNGNLEQRANINSSIELIAKLGELINSQADTFMSVIKQLNQSEDALKKAHDSLEQTVEERTRELRVAKESAETANKAKSIFFSKMSHELRTPLTIILGYSELMQKDPSIHFEQRKFLDAIYHNGEHLLVLINKVLEMSRIEGQHVNLEQVTFDSKEVCSNYLRFDNHLENGKAKEVPGTSVLELSPLQLRLTLSLSLLNELRAAVLSLDTTKTQEVLGRVTLQNPSIGTALERLALNLDYQRLLNLLEEDNTKKTCPEKEYERNDSPIT